MARSVRVRDFQSEIGKVSKVAGAARAPEQLTMDEILPGRVHEWVSVIPLDYGYRANCRCGWFSREVASKTTAQHLLRQHLLRTPQGQSIMQSLRKLGRAGNGA